MEAESREFANRREEQETAVTGCKRAAISSELVSKPLNPKRRVTGEWFVVGVNLLLILLKSFR